MNDIEITPRAETRIREIAQRERIDTGMQVLRVAVVSGGCSGLSYELGWDTAVQQDDRITALGDIRVAMDRRSYLYLTGTTLDFTEGLEGKGFHFHNPQAARTCACGESFSL
jgi:iron-sulfur cluster assembly protein